jgi:hypothetical protein
MKFLNKNKRIIVYRLNLKHLKQSKLFSHEKFIQIIYGHVSFN